MELPSDDSEQAPLNETRDVMADAFAVLRDETQEPPERLDAISQLRHAMQTHLSDVSTSSHDDLRVARDLPQVTLDDIQTLERVAKAPSATTPPEEVAGALELLRLVSDLAEECFKTNDEVSSDPRAEAIEAYRSVLDGIVVSLTNVYSRDTHAMMHNVDTTVALFDTLGYLARDFRESRLPPSLLGVVVNYIKRASSLASLANESGDKNNEERILVAWSAAVECACHVVGSGVGGNAERDGDGNTFANVEVDKDAFHAVVDAALASYQNPACDWYTHHGCETRVVKNSLESELARGGAARVLACSSPKLLTACSTTLALGCSSEQTPWIREALVGALRKVPVVAMTTMGDPPTIVTSSKHETACKEPMTLGDAVPSELADVSIDGQSAGDKPSPVPSDPFSHADIRRFQKNELDIVAGCLTDTCGAVRFAATNALALHGAAVRSVLSKLFPNLQSHDCALREATVLALDAAWREDDLFLPLLTNNTNRAVGGVGDFDAVTDKQPYAKDERDDAAAPAVPATMPTQPAAVPFHETPVLVDTQRKTLGTPAYVKRAMALTAVAASPLLRDPDGGVREATCELFGTLAEAAVFGATVGTLQDLMSNDVEESVRDAAVITLTKLGYYNPLTGRQQKKGFFGRVRARAFGDGDGHGTRKPTSSLSRRTLCEVGATVRVWWPDDDCFYEARIRAWDRENDTHTLLYIEDGIEEDLDLKKEKVELRYKPHKRGAKEAWLPVNKPAKKQKALCGPPRLVKQPKVKVPKTVKIKPPKPPRVKVEGVKKGEVVSPETEVRVFWPLDKAWYAGTVQSYDPKTKLHVVLYHDSLEESLDFSTELVTTVRMVGDTGDVRAGGDGDGDSGTRPQAGGIPRNTVPKLDGNPPNKIPVTCGTRGVGWFLPNARRGKERVSFVDENGDEKNVFAQEFASLFDDDDLGGDTKDDDETNYEKNDETNYEKNDDQKSPFASKPNPQKASLDQKKRWRRSCKFDPNRVSQFWKLRGGHRVISLGGFLASQGAAWGELVVGRPVVLRPDGFTYATGLSIKQSLKDVATKTGDHGTNEGDDDDGKDEGDGDDDTDDPASPPELEMRDAEPEPARDETSDEAAEPGTRDARCPDTEEIEEPQTRKSLLQKLISANVDGDDNTETKAGDEKVSSDSDPEAGLGSSDDNDDGGDEKSDSKSESRSEDSDSEVPKHWITTSIVRYSESSGEHQVLYPDGTKEWITLVVHETGRV